MYYFGIDVHKAYHKVVGLTADGEPIEYDIPNTEAGRENLRQLVAEHSPCQVAMEACTGAYKLYDLLEPVASSVRLLHPGDFRTRFPKKGRKNDRIDAQALCDAIRYNLKGIWVPDETVRQHRLLSSKRVSFTQRRTQSKNSLLSLFREYHLPLPRYPWSTKGRLEISARLEDLPDTLAIGGKLELGLIEQYDLAIEELDSRMAEIANDSEDIQLLMSIPGLNYHSSFVIMSEIGSHERFASAKQLTAYAGLCPRLSQSGASSPRLGSITKRGRSRLRWIAVECAHPAARFAPKLQKLYWRVKKRTGNASKAKVATGRKLLELCYHILKSRRPYSETVEEKYRAKLRNVEKVAGRRNAAKSS